MTQRKVFISYHHKNDQKFKDCLVSQNNQNDWFIDKSIEKDDIDPDNKTLTTKQSIKRQALDDTSVIVVLYGSETYKRKHVDWEIYGALTRRGDRVTTSGLVGVFVGDERKVHDRYKKNHDSGYSINVYWKDFISNPNKYIEQAIRKRDEEIYKMDNSAPQMKYNKE